MGYRAFWDLGSRQAVRSSSVSLRSLDVRHLWVACRRCRLHLVPPEASLLPHELARLIRRSELTQWFSVPSTMAYMAKLGAVPEGGFETLERVIWCGEVLPTPSSSIGCRGCRTPVSRTSMGRRRRRSQAVPHRRANSVRRNRAIPIGKPCADEELLILDENLTPVPAGEIGELRPGAWE